ncbi:MAG: hypothetical protein ACTHM5_12960 [Ginsengibacter sp.]
MIKTDPFKILPPNERWVPTQSQMDAFQNAYEKLLQPLIYKIRLVVTKWREGGYKGASATSVSLLNFWFSQEHLIGQKKFSFFFSQREAITLKYIPKDVFDKRAVEKGQVKFFDVAYLNTKEKIKGKTITIQLTDFVTHYTQDDIEELQQTMRSGSKVVIEDGQIFKIEKDKKGIIHKTLLTENWYDWIDYWAIDFNYEDKKEIIKIKNDKGETEEKWTGNYLFENEWQSYRTKKNPTLEFTSIIHEYPKSGKYKVMVKVVDILGIDTSKIVEVRV